MGLTRLMANELATKNINVNAIAPGYIETHLLNASWYFLSEEEKKEAKTQAAAGIPLGRIGDPTDIADVMIFLASDASRYIVAQTLVVDGGTTSWMPFGEQFKEPFDGQFGQGYVPGI